ncbi:MAG TPA: CBS domain-containing protein [Thermoleophilaceae bacterium]|jgi:CBS domain-containing protein
MTQEALSPPPVEAASAHSPRPQSRRDPLLDREVADFMTPGCVVISEAASVADAARAMARHRVHAVLVVGAQNGTPLGWITHRGLLGWIGRDRELARARDAITEQVTAIPAHESVRVALYALSTSGTTRLLVRSRPSALPEGVLTDFDLAMAAS